MQAYRSRLQQAMQGRRTAEAESSSWPTPVASESKRAKEDPRSRPNGNRNGRSLTSLTALWPTVVVTDEASSGRATTLANPENSMKPGTSLTDAMRIWSTPKATDDKRGASPNRENPGGGDRNLPTDVVNFHRDQTTSKGGDDGSPQAVLNPEFCRELMGFPAGWLDVE